MKSRFSQLQNEIAKERKILTSVASLAKYLPKMTRLAFDFETSGVNPNSAVIAGLGLYAPDLDKSWYLNIGHSVANSNLPRQSWQEVLNILGPWFTAPNNHAIAHNAPFDLRCFFRLGLFNIKCRISDSMVWVHRTDENLRSRSESGDRTYSYHIGDAPNYGLKNLTQHFFNQVPPTLDSATGGFTAVDTDPAPVAEYCVQDCINTWNLFVLAEKKLSRPVRKLVQDIDDPNNMVVAKMMWQGIEIDAEEAAKQQAVYETTIQRCREEIWKTLGRFHSLEKPNDIRRLLKSLNFKEELYDDPFDDRPPKSKNDDSGESGHIWTPSIASGVLIRLIDELPETSESKIKIITLILAKRQMKQRIDAFLRPMPNQSIHTGNRLYLNRFSSLLSTTRFSCSPNAQNMPGRADKGNVWEKYIPDDCLASERTRSIIVAKEGHQLVSGDLSAAEPRYLALHFAEALKRGSSDFKYRRDLQRKMLWRKYPFLMQERARLQKKKQSYTPLTIDWPKILVDPLWKVFHDGDDGEFGGDPYNALLAAMMPDEYAAASDKKGWLDSERWRGKKAFLALGYGAGASSLAWQLGWSVEKTQAALDSIESQYPVLQPLRNLIFLNMVHFGQVESLFGRPRRINGYYQLAQCEPCRIGFYRMRPFFRQYEAEIIPLGSTNPSMKDGVIRGGGGVQCLMSKLGWVQRNASGDKELRIVYEADPSTGREIYRDPNDCIVSAPHFNNLPFRNINFGQLDWVELESEPGVTRFLPEQARAVRVAFNALCQVTGADHLRWLMNEVDAKVVSRKEFEDCHLILTVHDSLLFEVPNEKVTSFAIELRRLATVSPSFSNLPTKFDVEVGPDLGRMRKLWFCGF